MESPENRDMWHVLVDGVPSKPMTFEDMLQLSDKNHLFRSDLVWNPHARDWMQADEVADLFSGNKKKTDEEELIDRMSGNYQSVKSTYKPKQRNKNLLSCKACSHDVSEQAFKCYECGHPTAKGMTIRICIAGLIFMIFFFPSIASIILYFLK